MPEDPKTKLTNWLTKVDADEEAGTRLMNKEQKAFYLGYMALADELDIDFFKEVVMLDERLMMAYQGRRSDDVVIALSKIKDDEPKDVGLQPLREILKKQEKEYGKQ